MTLKRIKKEIIDFNRNSDGNISINQVDEKDLYHYHVIIIGPHLSPYENGIFYLSIHYPEGYPFKPLQCRFITQIYHPNINAVGTIWINYLKDDWSPSFTIFKITLIIIDLLLEPDFENPFVREISELYKKNKFEYYKKAQEFAVKYADAPKYDKLYYLPGEQRIDYELNHMDYGEKFNITKLEDKNKCKINFKYNNEMLNFDVNYP